MKEIIILALIFSILLTACAPRNAFMRGYKVGSGDYYLTAQNGSLLFDDPQILQKYRNEVRTRKLEYRKRSGCNNPLIIIAMNFLCLVPEQEKGDNTLKLIHKTKGVVNVLESNYTYDMPPEMYQTAKRLQGDETWHNPEAFLQRIKQLEAIEGLNILSASKIEPPRAANSDAPPVYDHLINIYFPLLISPIEYDFSEDKIDTIKEDLRNSLEQELQQLEITQYQVITVKHRRHRDNFVSKQIRLHEHYNTLVPPPLNGEFRYYDDQYLKIDKYRADLFVIQIHCDQQCANAIEKRKPLDLLPTNISHTDFINEIKAVVEQAGGIFNPEFTFLEEKVHLPPDYINSPKSYDLYGRIEVTQKLQPKISLTVHWQYDLQRALNYPYPLALDQGAPQ